MTKISKLEKRDRFKRLAVYRTNEVLRKLRILGHCANRSAYDYNEDDVARIFSELERETKETRAKFHAPSNKKRFTLNN